MHPDKQTCIYLFIWHNTLKKPIPVKQTLHHCSALCKNISGKAQLLPFSLFVLWKLFPIWQHKPHQIKLLFDQKFTWQHFFYYEECIILFFFNQILLANMEKYLFLYSGFHIKGIPKSLYKAERVVVHWLYRRMWQPLCT